MPLFKFFLEFINFPKVLSGLICHRRLILSLTWRDFLARYRGSFGGLFWSFVQPLVMMIIYTIVFSLFLKVQFTGDDNPFTFSVYLLCGLLPWLSFSEALMAAAGVIRANVNFVKRVVFPLEILPLNLVLQSCIHQLIGFAILIPLSWWVTGKVHSTIFFVPAILAVQMLLAVGLSWIVASLAVFIPDLTQLLSLLLTAWMFLTPIFYPEEVVSSQFQSIFRLNPMTCLIGFYRNAFMKGSLPDTMDFSVLAGIALLTFLFGHFWFAHMKKGFADVL